MLARGVLALLHGVVEIGHQQPAHQGEQRQHEGQRNDRGLRHETHVAKGPHAGRPYAVVLKEAGAVCVRWRRGRAVAGTGKQGGHGCLDYIFFQTANRKSACRKVVSVKITIALIVSIDYSLPCARLGRCAQGSQNA
ncbi:hypothetical protein SDC9_207331 [bioreactor metagenome]|uniref:Uncharacterized protein n=1 Tax=bioreactor metagenome TaxID=1076179 RepID=A0A645J8Z0_9ZZZZ